MMTGSRSGNLSVTQMLCQNRQPAIYKIMMLTVKKAGNVRGRKGNVKLAVSVAAIKN
jgi:hypothetical protein